MANSIDHDQMLQTTASDLGLHGLLRPFSSNTLDKYGNIHLLTLWYGHVLNGTMVYLNAFFSF